MPTSKNPIPSINEKYNSLWKNEWKYLLSIGPGVRTRQRILKKFVKKYITNGSLIDIGCGDGRFMTDLHKEYGDSLQIFGADISEEALDEINKLGFLSDTFLIDISDKNTLPKQKYGALIASEVLEHIEDWRTALINISSLLEPKGYVFITVPALMKHMSIHDEFAHHFRRFEIGEIESILKEIGFHIKEDLCWGWPIYSLYYSLLLRKLKPESVMTSQNSFIKKIGSFILYYLFFIDDLFPTRNGRRLFIVGQKKV